MSRTELIERAHIYAERKDLVLGRQLGFGVHGIVYAAENQSNGRSAIKAHERGPDYGRERDVYFRLREHDITQIRGCTVPELIGYDDELWIIEMTMVFRPYVLDFAGAFLDRAPDFSEEVLADWRAEKQEQFGKHWREAEAILRALEGHGIFVIDVNTNNISLGD